MGKSTAKCIAPLAAVVQATFDGEVAGVIAIALIMCGVVIIVVNGRSKRK